MVRAKMTRRHFLGGLCGLGALGGLGGLGHAGALPALAAPPTQATPPDAIRLMSHGSDVLQSRMVEVGALRYHMLESTVPPPDDAPIVVLVHGLALSGQYMVPVAEALAPHYRLYAPDFPGFGDSDKPSRALDVPGLADALADWMDAMNLPPVMMLGNSFGCQIIVDFATRYPDRVSRAVLQGPTTPPEERSWMWQFYRWRQNAPNNPPLMADVADVDYAKCGLVRALTTFEFSLRDRIEDKLVDVRQPMLVVRGETDPICRQEWAEKVTRLLPDGRLQILPDVAHTLVFTAPHQLAGAARPFFDEDPI